MNPVRAPFIVVINSSMKDSPHDWEISFEAHIPNIATWIKFLTDEFEKSHIQTTAYVEIVHKPVHGSYAGLIRKCYHSIYQ